MAHGAPDYSNVVNYGDIYRLDDMAELAVRLGSPMIYDRRGISLFVYDFKYGIGGFTLGESAGGEVSLSNVNWLTPPYCVYLKTGSGFLYTSYIKKNLPIPNNPIIGFAVAINALSDTELITLNLIYHINSVQYTATIRYHVNDNKISILNESGSYEDIATGLTPIFGFDNFINLKMVVDLNNLVYKYFNVANITYDLSSYNLESLAQPSSGYIEFKISVSNAGADASEAYLDNFIVTTNEPI